MIQINVAFTASMLLVGWQEGHLSCKSFCFKTPGMMIHVSGPDNPDTAKYLPVSAKSFVLSSEDSQHKDDGRLRLRGQLANPGLTGKWPLNGVCVRVYVN